MKYVKPEFIVEEFMLNSAVAACDREWNGEVETEWPVQEVLCGQSGKTKDKLFASENSACQYEPCHMIYLDGGTYSETQLIAAGLTNIKTDGGGGKGGKGGSGGLTVPAGGGYVLCWGNGDHYGNATPELVKVMTSSY